MVYRFMLSRNPRLLLLPAISVIIVSASFSAILFWNPLIGFLLLGGSAYLSYKLLKFYRTHLKSLVRVNDEGISGITAIGGKFSFTWENLSLAGEFQKLEGERELFLYSDELDLLIRIPLLYTEPEKMSAELEKNAGEFVRWQGHEHGDLEVRLRERFAVEKI